MGDSHIPDFGAERIGRAWAERGQLLDPQTETPGSIRVGDAGVAWTHEGAGAVVVAARSGRPVADGYQREERPLSAEVLHGRPQALRYASDEELYRPPLEGPASMLSAGDEHTCALLEDRTVRCWGWWGSRQVESVHGPSAWAQVPRIGRVVQ